MKPEKTKQQPQTETVNVIRAVAACTKCGRRETFYIDEKQKTPIKYVCGICENDEFVITYK